MTIARLASVERRLVLVQWMVGTNLALTLGLVWLVFRLGERVAAIAAKLP